MMNVKIDMGKSYSGKSWQEEKLMRMFAWMELCGDFGHTINFAVIFHGDGTAQMHCNFETEELREKYNQIKKEMLDVFNKQKDPEYFEFGM